ncbi:MAG: acyl-CoA thioesterase [Myxococcales bacterium]|nr:acyl-CoA thioesterase [Myxococcales bacterium]
MLRAMERSPEPAIACASAIFRHRMIVTSADIDLLGHASNVAYVRWIQDAARAHSEHVGLGISAYAALGAVFVVRRHEIDYLRSAFESDELEIETWIASWSAATSQRCTRILRRDEELARAKTTWALVSMEAGRPCRIPKQVRAAFFAARAAASE